MKKRIVFLLGVLVGVGIIALVGAFFGLGAMIKKGVETAGPRLAQVDVKLDGAKVSPLSGQGTLSGFVVGNPAGYQTPSAFQVSQAHLALDVRSLFSDTVVIREVRIEQPQITFEGGLKANNLSQIIENLKKATGGSDTGSSGPTEPSASEPEKKFAIHELLIRGGQVNVSLKGMGGRSLTVSLPDVHMQDLGTPEHGLTSRELSLEIAKRLLAQVLEAVSSGQLSGLSEQLKHLEVGKSNSLQKAAQGVFDLLKRHQ